MARQKSKSNLECLPPFDSESKAVNVVIETPKGCRNKFKFDESCGVFKDMNSNLLAELEHFFESYNEIRGKKFKLLGHRGPGRADKLLRAGIRKARKEA